MRKLVKFSEYLKEEQDNQELVDKVEAELQQKSEDCPRCGEPLDGCECQRGGDRASTRNTQQYTGKVKQSKTKFK